MRRVWPTHRRGRAGDDAVSGRRALTGLLLTGVRRGEPGPDFVTMVLLSVLSFFLLRTAGHVGVVHERLAGGSPVIDATGSSFQCHRRLAGRRSWPVLVFIAPGVILGVPFRPHLVLTFILGFIPYGALSPAPARCASLPSSGGSEGPCDAGRGDRCSRRPTCCSP